MDVENGKIDTILSEQILQDFVSHNNLSAFAKQVDKRNYLVLVKDGEETTIDEANADFFESVGDTLFFHDLRFSPSGRYLIYMTSGWEWGGGRIFDITTRQRVFDSSSPFVLDFTPDEKYLYTCANDHFGGVSYGSVYSTHSFDLIYDLQDTPANKGYFDLSCEYDSDNYSLFFYLSNKYNQDGEFIEDEKRTIEYSFDTEQDKMVK